MPKTACCIGINYEGTAKALGGCINDAHLWSEWLGHVDYRTDTLTERDATRDRILEAMRRSLVDAGAGGLCAFSYAGHGSYRRDDDGDEPDGRDELWCPYDWDQGAVISDDEIFALMSEFPDRQCLIINDSCFGGSIARVALAEAAFVTNEARPRVRFLPPSEIPGNLQDRPRRARAAAPSVIVMSGCEDTEFTFEDTFVDRRTGEAKTNGAFTHIASLCLRIVGRQATYDNWISEVRRYLPSARFPQSPRLQGDGTRTIFQ